MQRHTATYPLATGQVKEIKQRMLNWAKQFSILLFLDNNDYTSARKGYECLLATGVTNSITGNDGDLLNQLQQLHDTKRDWIFGHLCYDYKNILEPKLTSAHSVNIDFPLLHFFIPKTVCYISSDKTKITIESFDDPQTIYNEIMASDASHEEQLPKLQFKSRVEQGSSTSILFQSYARILQMVIVTRSISVQKVIAIMLM